MFCLPELPPNWASVFGLVAAIANLEWRSDAVGFVRAERLHCAGGVRRADACGFGGGIFGGASGNDSAGAEFEGGGVGTSRHGERENRFSAGAGVHYCRARNASP